MNWSQLRPLLRDKFKHEFYFYNDANINTGNRRIKIRSRNLTEILNYIKTIAPELDAKFYEFDSITIHYKNI